MNDFHFDFEVLLVGLVFLSGIVWLVDKILWEKERIAASGEDPIAIEYAKSFFPVLLVVMILRSFVMEPFRIPSGSMMSTLLIGDFILVNKYAYGFRLPVSHNKVTEGEAPKRGDVAVFRFPHDPSFDYIKRVIGLPGDVIKYSNKKLIINGEPVETQEIGVYSGQGSGSDSMKGLKVFEEQLGDIKHQYLVDPKKGTTMFFGNGDFFVAEGEYVVPEGEYFMMGDNRDNSNDGRYWGFVPEENLVGKAFMIWMHWDWSDQGSGLDVSRIGTKF